MSSSQEPQFHKLSTENLVGANNNMPSYNAPVEFS